MTKHIASALSESSLEKLAEEDIQPNAVDLRIDKIWEMSGVFKISEDGKRHREKRLIDPLPDGYYALPIGSYEISFDNTVKMGPSEAGFVITRSTLNRNGVFITSGLYDSGYHGSLAACLHVIGGPTLIQKGTRVGQFLLWDAETLHQYDGDYGLTADGKVKDMEKQYFDNVRKS